MMVDLIGAPFEDLETPLLLVDGLAVDRNIQRMADFFRGRSCQLRPHFKNHKCARIARKQIEAGSAVGMTCAKITEAEVLADAGIEEEGPTPQRSGLTRSAVPVTRSCRVHGPRITMSDGSLLEVHRSMVLSISLRSKALTTLTSFMPMPRASSAMSILGASSFLADRPAPGWP